MAVNSPLLQIGTSGWVYKHWMNIFYPINLPPDQYLSFYTQHFSTVEVNFSFYRLPEKTVFENWRLQTPNKFIFAVKGSRYLTHLKKLKDPIEPLSRLMDRVLGLQEKLGPILFQFPHTWHINLERLQPFLELLQSYSHQRYTLEFRHSSWLNPQVYKLLESAGMALCLPVSPTIPLEIYLTAPWIYIRMHQGKSGIGYSDDELSYWSQQIKSFLIQGFDVYVYFNNDAEGYAIRDAHRLSNFLNLSRI